MNDKRTRRSETAVFERPDLYDNDKYFANLLEQYKTCIEMVDRLSARRVLVNNTFITLIGAGAIAYTASAQQFPGGFGVLL